MFFVLSTATAWNSRSTPALVLHMDVYQNSIGGEDMPLGDAEENSEDKDITEEEDDDVSLDHGLHSRHTSRQSDLHFLYQQILFKDLEIEIVIPPPRA